MIYNVVNENELESVVLSILSEFCNTKIFLLKGNLGAGKTTMVKYFVSHLGYQGKVQSPTYGIINEYQITNNKTIYHLDLYRLKKTAEAIDIGIEDYLYSNNFCFIEWFEIIEELLPKNVVIIELIANGNTRTISTTFI